MKSFKKYLNENIQQEDYEKNRREMLDSIHSMPLEDAKAYAELDLITEPSVFSDDWGGANHPSIRGDHAFTKYLTHPEHSDESVLEDLNFLMRLAHQRDISDPENFKEMGRVHHAGVYKFASENFPTVAYAMGNILLNEPFSKDQPIQITPDLLQNIKKEHGYIRRGKIYKPNIGIINVFMNAKKQILKGRGSHAPDDVYRKLFH